ncbi:MAG: glycosyl hydrolase family 28-related protein [Pseudomonadota bacterium]
MQNVKFQQKPMLTVCPSIFFIFMLAQGVSSTVALAEPGTNEAYFVIKNRWTNAYLFDGGNDLQYKVVAPTTPPEADKAYQWSFAPRGNGYFDIKNRKTGDLINIERLHDSVQSDRGCPVGGDSSKWAFENTPDGYVRLRNGWHMGDYLHTQDQRGFVQHGMMYPVWESAQWQIKAVTITLSIGSEISLDQPKIINKSPQSTQTPAPVSGGGEPSGNQPSVTQPSATQPSDSISINVLSHGVLGDGRTDNQAALQKAIDAAKAQGKIAWIPAGTYNHSGVLTLDGAKVQGAGPSTILNATNPDRSAIKLIGNNSSVSSLKTTVVAPNRSSMPDPAAILVQNASNASVTHILVQGAASNGIRLDGAVNSRIFGNLTLGTNADGIALMNGSVGNMVVNNVVYQAGDDSYSDDSYRGDARQDENNSFIGNVSIANAYGRGICLAGSKNDTVKDNIISGSKWMGIYADSDPDSGTMASSGHNIQNNTVINNPNGPLVQATSPGSSVSGTKGTGSIPNLPSFLGWNPGELIDRYKFNPTYKPGTGSGANNSGGNRS